MFWEDILRLGAALLAGAIVGLERELHDKPAGFRTNIMICVGSAVFTLLSIRIAEQFGGDHTRIAAQIVTGVGFLGAGAIIQSRGHVTGLTTAATVWAVASLGMAFGAGYYRIGILGTAVIHGVLVGLVYIGDFIDRRRTVIGFEIRTSAADGLGTIRRIIEESGVRGGEWVVEKEDGQVIVKVVFTGAKEKLLRLQKALLEEPSVSSLCRV
jgi:putative Mg2+ transporter-C (MgtC) family protein